MIETTRVPGYREQAVSLTKDGRSLLESHRDHDHEHPQTFYAGLGCEREFEHDLQVYRPYEQAEARLLDAGQPGHPRRVRGRRGDHPEFVAEIVESFPVRYSPTKLSIIRHEPDNRFLECALAANADFIVTVNTALGHFDR